MKRFSALGLVVLALTAMLAAGCNKEPQPMPGPTAQDYFDNGLRYYKNEQWNAAAQEFESAVAARPGFVEAYTYLGQSYVKLNMNDKAKRAFAQAVDANGRYVPAREGYGILAFKNLDYFEAKRQLEAARQLGSINPEVYSSLGRIYLMDKNCKEALETLAKGLSIDSGYYPLREAMDEARRSCGRGAAAAPSVRIEKKMTGSGRAIDPSDF